METAKQLNLKLIDVSGYNKVMETNEGPVPIEYGAEEVRLKVRDRELCCGIYMVYEKDAPTLIGMPALYGALIQFYHDGRYEICLSGELDEEEEMRLYYACNERIEQYKRQQQAKAEEEPPTSVSN